MNFDFILDQESQALYLHGLMLTLTLLLGGAVCSFLLAIPMAIARNARTNWLRYSVWAFTYVLRGTPLLLQLYLIYFGLSQFVWVRESALWWALSNPLFCALLALTLNELAYTTEIFAGAMRSLPVGEIEAAHAFGMRPVTVLRRIIIPAALRNCLPTYSNEIIILLHSTSLAATVTLMDLTGAANEIYARYYLPFEAFMVGALFYMALTYGITRLFRLAEHHFLVHQRPRTT